MKALARVRRLQGWLDGKGIDPDFQLDTAHLTWADQKFLVDSILTYRKIAHQFARERNVSPAYLDERFQEEMGEQ